MGPVDTALINESRNAAMICVGSVGIGPIARALLGSTASALAEKAHCPVAIIRTPHDKPVAAADWIVVVVDDDPDNGAVIESAMNEAPLRQAPILSLGVWLEDLGQIPYATLDRRVEVWKERYPDVHFYSVATRGGVARFLAENRDESVQLAVVGSTDAYQSRQIIGPHRHAKSRHGECSVLLVR